MIYNNIKNIKPPKFLIEKPKSKTLIRNFEITNNIEYGESEYDDVENDYSEPILYLIDPKYPFKGTTIEKLKFQLQYYENMKLYQYNSIKYYENRLNNWQPYLNRKYNDHVYLYKNRISEIKKMKCVLNLKTFDEMISIINKQLNIN